MLICEFNSKIMPRNDANIDRYVVVLYPKDQSRTCPDWLLYGKNHSTNSHLECLNCIHCTVHAYYLATMLHLELVSVFHQDCVHLKSPSTPRSQCLEMPDIIPNRRAAYFWLMWPKAKEKRDKNTRVFHLNSAEYNVHTREISFQKNKSMHLSQYTSKAMVLWHIVWLFLLGLFRLLRLVEICCECHCGTYTHQNRVHQKDVVCFVDMLITQMDSHTQKKLEIQTPKSLISIRRQQQKNTFTYGTIPEYLNASLNRWIRCYCASVLHTWEQNPATLCTEWISILRRVNLRLHDSLTLMQKKVLRWYIQL